MSSEIPPSDLPRRRLRLLVTLGGVAVAVGACRPTPGTSASVNVSDSAGVRIVESHGRQWSEGQAWSVSAVPSVTVGILDGPSEHQLFRISAAARQSDGDIVVVDAGTREVRLFDRRGAFVRLLGGPGSGPGEFQDPAHVVIAAADSVLVWDDANYRMTRFDSAGAFVGVQSVDRSGIMKAVDPPLYPGPAKLLPDGDIVVRLVEKAAKDVPAGAFRRRSGALRVSADISQIDTLMFFGGVEQVGVRAPWGEWWLSPPLARRAVTAVHATSSRVCIGTQEGPEVVCFGPAAARTVIRWHSEPAEITEWEIAIWQDTTIAQYAPKLSEAQIREVLAQVPVPASRPHYTRTVLDRAGNLWVELGPVKAAGRESNGYLVFDLTGVLLGAVALPRIQVLEIGEDYVMGIHRDELDVQYLHVYEIVKPGSGAMHPQR